MSFEIVRREDYIWWQELHKDPTKCVLPRRQLFLLNVYSYPKNANYKDEQIFKWVPFTIVAYLKHYKLPCAERVHSLCSQSLSIFKRVFFTRPPRTCKTIVAIIAQKKLFHIVRLANVEVISSRAKRTPPTGDPNATATPAALEAVSISRISATLFV